MRVHQLEAGADRGRADHLLELAEHALGRDTRQARRVAGDRGRGRGLDRQVELDRDPDGAQRAQRVVGERVGPDHAQAPRLEVGAAAVRVQQLAAGQRLGHRVDGEVARGEVGHDVAVAQDHEVDVPGVTRADDAPGAERAGELERRAAGRTRERARGLPRVVRQREVEVGRGAAEQPVAHRAADDPRVAAGEDSAHVLERHGHRTYSRGTRGPIPHVIS